jgi:hypothetical protein
MFEPSLGYRQDMLQLEYDALCEQKAPTGPKIEEKLEEWFIKWVVLEHKLKKTTVPGISPAAACKAFVYASRDINPPFFNYMIGKWVDDEMEGPSRRDSMMRQERTLVAVLKATLAVIPATIAIRTPNSSAPSSTMVTATESTATTDLMKLPTELERANTELESRIAELESCIIEHESRINDLKDKNYSPGEHDMRYHVNTFRNFAYYHRKTVPYAHQNGKRSSTVAFGAESATFNGESHSVDSEDGHRPAKKADTRKLCICSSRHDYIECWYLNPAKASKKWSPKAGTKAVVISAFNGNSRKASMIRKTFKKHDQKLVHWLK